MPTANETIADALIRHQVYLLRYAGGESNKLNDSLKDSEEEIADRIRSRLRDNVGLESPADWRRLQGLQAAATDMRSEAWDAAQATLIDDMVALSVYEAAFVDALVVGAMPVELTTLMPSKPLLKSIVTTQPFEGWTLKRWAQNIQAEDIRRIHAAIQTGMLSGETGDTIARRITGTARLKGTDGMTEIMRRQAKAIVRTAVSHVTDASREAWYAENGEYFDLEAWIATLDSRTTPVCRARDGKIFPRGKGPRPPAHIACRSIRVAMVNDELMGSRPMKPVTERQLLEEFAGVNNRDQLPYGKKGEFDRWARKRTREMVGTVPAKTTYGDWMKRQPVDFQSEVLGRTKAELFRKGNLSLDRFVDLNGAEYTLAELARREAGAFRAAGLDPAAF